MQLTTIAELGKPLARGREAEIYHWGDGQVLRLLFAGRGSQAQLEHEAAVAAIVRAGGVPAPAHGEVIEIEGRLGVVMERVDGADLLAGVARRPWTVYPVGAQTARLHARVAEVVAPSSFQSVRERHRVWLDGATPDRVPPGIRGRALAILETLPDGDRVIHGDFHPGNILAGTSGPVVIDWTGYRGDPLADFTGSLMLMKVATPPDAPLVIQLLEKPGRRVLIAGYDRTYRRLCGPFDPRLEARWLAVNVAARLQEGIEGERPALLRLWDKTVRAT